MKKSFYHIIVFIVLVCFSTVGLTQSPVFEEPVLLTSAGQSADTKIAKLLLTRAGLKFNIAELADVDKLNDVKTLVIVAGGSLKGLGAANIDQEKELKRIEKLVAQAKKDKIKTLTMHIGGKSRRGKLSDPFCETSGKAADFLIVAKAGNEDGFFTKIADANKAEIRVIKNSAEAIPVLKEVFGKNK